MTLPSPTRKLGINCDPRCNFHPDKIGWDAATKLAATRARGAGAITWARAASEVLGREIKITGGIGRHFDHYVGPADAPAPEDSAPKPSDIDILDSIIGSGFRNSKNWKPSIRDTLEAMKLKASMTGNSAFQDLIELFDIDVDPDALPESLEAVLSPEERPDEGDEELEEPLPGE